MLHGHPLLDQALREPPPVAFGKSFMQPSGASGNATTYSWDNEDLAGDTSYAATQQHLYRHHGRAIVGIGLANAASGSNRTVASHTINSIVIPEDQRAFAPETAQECCIAIGLLPISDGIVDLGDGFAPSEMSTTYSASMGRGDGACFTVHNLLSPKIVSRVHAAAATGTSRSVILPYVPKGGMVLVVTVAFDAVITALSSIQPFTAFFNGAGYGSEAGQVDISYFIAKANLYNVPITATFDSSDNQTILAISLR